MPGQCRVSVAQHDEKSLQMGRRICTAAASQIELIVLQIGFFLRWSRLASHQTPRLGSAHGAGSRVYRLIKREPRSAFAACLLSRDRLSPTPARACPAFNIGPTCRLNERAARSRGSILEASGGNRRRNPVPSLIRPSTVYPANQDLLPKGKTAGNRSNGLHTREVGGSRPAVRSMSAVPALLRSLRPDQVE